MLERSVRAIDSLLTNWVKVFNATRDEKHTDDHTPGYRETKVRLRSIKARPKPQPVVTILYGPSGAGKSTLFNHLTGLNAPKSVIRPTTYSSLAAISPGLQDEEWLQAAFPDQCLKRLDSPEELKDANAATNLLFYAPSEQIPQRNGWAPVLLDLPDFGNVEGQNRERAEKSLERAEQVLFVATNVTYSDRKLVEELERACRVAGTLVFILAQTPPPKFAGAEYADDRAVAQSLRKDLLKKLYTHSAFQSWRADGQTLLEFLANVDAYFIPYGLPLKVCSLNGDARPLEDRIFGAAGESLITWSLVEPAYQLAQGCREEAREIESRKLLLRTRMQKIDEDLAGAALKVETFPAGQFDELLREELEKHAGVLKYPKWGMELVGGTIVAAYRFVNGHSDKSATNREELEREQLQKAAQDLIQKWRAEFGDDRRWRANLQEADCNSALQQMDEARLPEPKMGAWNAYVRKSLKTWASENGDLVGWINLVSTALAGAGVVAIAADVFIGGPILTLGLPAALGSVGVVAAFVADWFKDDSLRAIAKHACEKWKTYRSAELQSYLQVHFAHPLLKHGYEEWNRLKQAPVTACLNACDEIERLASELRGAHDVA